MPIWTLLSFSLELIIATGVRTYADICEAGNVCLPLRAEYYTAVIRIMLMITDDDFLLIAFKTPDRCE